MHRTQILITLAGLAFAGACAKKSDDKAAPESGEPSVAPSAGAGAAEPKKQPLTAAWLGKTVVPPGELGKLKPGMKKEEAESASPLAKVAGTQASEIEGVDYAVQHGLEGTALIVALPADKATVIEEAWGPGQKVDRGGKPVTVWFNPAQGIRAALSHQNNRLSLRFEPYTPLAKLLGEGPQIAFLDKSFVGKTKDELKALYPSLVSQTGNLALPSTEWEFGSGTPLSTYPMDGQAKSLSFAIPFKTPEGQAEIMKVVDAKWGKAKGEVKGASAGGEKTFIYNKQDPHVEITEPGGKDAVRFRISDK